MSEQGRIALGFVKLEQPRYYPGNGPRARGAAYEAARAFITGLPPPVIFHCGVEEVTSKSHLMRLLRFQVSGKLQGVCRRVEM